MLDVSSFHSVHPSNQDLVALSRCKQCGGSSICEHTVTTTQDDSASNAAGRASASTTAKEARASNAAGRASASTTAKDTPSIAAG
jgi:hypothetical protein